MGLLTTYSFTSQVSQISFETRVLRIAGSFLIRASTKLSANANPRVTRRLANNIGAKVTTTCVASGEQWNFHASRAHERFCVEKPHGLRFTDASSSVSRARSISLILRIYHAFIRMQWLAYFELLSLISSHKSRSSDAQLTVCRWFCMQIICVPVKMSREGWRTGFERWGARLLIRFSWFVRFTCSNFNLDEALFEYCSSDREI